jgi:hypothetical protein
MKYIIATISTILFFCACNKEKKLMKTLEGNWIIESSEKILYHKDGSEETLETLSNSGKLIISEGSSNEDKMYDFFFIDSNLDTIKSANKLVTDEFNNRMIMLDGLTDSTGNKNIVWTIEKTKKNKQTWSTYGVDSTLFYPTNNQNPGAAENWVVWKIYLKRE